MLGKLVDGHVLDQQTADELKLAFKTGSQCVHGQPVAFSEVAHLLDRVRLLLVTHPVNEDTCDLYYRVVQSEGKKGTVGEGSDDDEYDDGYDDDGECCRGD